MPVLRFIYSVLIYIMFLGTFLYAIGFLGNFIVPKSVDSGESSNLVWALINNLALLGIFGLQHSIMARRGFKAVWTKIISVEIERSTYVLATNLCLILLYWKWIPIPQLIWNFEMPIVAYLLWGLFASGWLIVLVSTFCIDHFELFGLKQTLLPLLKKQPGSTQFMQRGLYKYCRHPIMLGFIIAMFATPQMSIGHLVFAMAASAYIYVALIFEERDLISAHGDKYLDYKKSTPKVCPFRVFSKG